MNKNNQSGFTLIVAAASLSIFLAISIIVVNTMFSNTLSTYLLKREAGIAFDVGTALASKLRISYDKAASGSCASALTLSGKLCKDPSILSSATPPLICVPNPAYTNINICIDMDNDIFDLVTATAPATTAVVGNSPTCEYNRAVNQTGVGDASATPGNNADICEIRCGPGGNADCFSFKFCQSPAGCGSGARSQVVQRVGFLK